MRHKVTSHRSLAPHMLPNLLLFGLFRRPQTSADRLNRAYQVFYWHFSRSLRHRIYILLAALISPLRIVKEIISQSDEAGSFLALDGKARWRQHLEQFYLAFFYSIDVDSYYLQEFYRLDGMRRARNFVHKKALKSGVYLLLANYGKYLNRDGENVSFGDKASFSSFLSEKGLAVVPVLQIVTSKIKPGRRIKKNTEELTLPCRDLFCKPKIDNEGVGAEAWFWKGDGNYENTFGLVLDAKSLQQRLKEKAKNHFSGAYLVQPLVLPHPALSPFRIKATPTVRIISYVDRSGLVKIDRAMFRFSDDPLSVVDNAGAGGLVAPIDVASGKLGLAVVSDDDKSIGYQRGSRLEQLCNGTPVAGFLLPFWQETLELTLRAHSFFSSYLFVGWDLIITSSGPLILEANSQPGLCYLQKAHLLTLGEMAAGEAMAGHAGKAIEVLYSGWIGDLENDRGAVNLYENSKIKKTLGLLRIGGKQSVRLVIHGKVQGVYYRKWFEKVARSLMIEGTVRNQMDGTVEALVKGKAMDLENLVRACWKGPEKARVSSIEASLLPVPVQNGFKVLRDK